MKAAITAIMLLVSISAYADVDDWRKVWEPPVSHGSNSLQEIDDSRNYRGY